MNLPTTKEYLQNFDKNKYMVDEDNKIKFEYYDILIKHIADGIKYKLLHQPSVRLKLEPQFTWKYLELLPLWNTYMTYGKNGDLVAFYQKNRNPFEKVQEYYIHEFVGLLKDNFIGCKIIVDPLKIYIIIDWS
jgi:hypothetical protein